LWVLCGRQQSLSPVGTRTPCRPFQSLVVVPNSLSRLLITACKFTKTTYVRLDLTQSLPGPFLVG
jgi:hypothetical protein